MDSINGSHSGAPKVVAILYIGMCPRCMSFNIVFIPVIHREIRNPSRGIVNKIP